MSRWQFQGPGSRYCSVVMLLLLGSGCETLYSAPGTPPEKHFQVGELRSHSVQAAELFSGLPVRKWIRIHQQKPGDPVFFRHQQHGGSAFDSRRGHLILFGSDTHGRDWNNSPLMFDLEQLQWRRLYPDDAAESYRVNSDGLPVAGPEANHPWAMHTFGAVEYDSFRDELVVSSYPWHMEPGRFSDRLGEVWPKVGRHPTWVLNLENGEWRALDAPAVHFFPYATAFDADRGVVVGHRDMGVYELAGPVRQWQRTNARRLLGYHNNAVYDRCNRQVIVMGSENDSNDVIAYDPVTREQRVMPTPGERPPADQHIPMAFHTRLGQVVALVDRWPADSWPQRELSSSETWLYDFGLDQWAQVPEATLPFGAGMNFNLEYDPHYDVLLLVTSEPGHPTSVWALRL